MIKLDSPDLPAVSRPLGRSAPIARLFTSDNHTIAPIARFDLYAHYQNPGFDPTGIASPDPDYVGILFRLDMGATIAALETAQVGQGVFGYVADPLAIFPSRLWLDSTNLNLYGTTTMQAGDSLVVKASLESTVLSDEETAGIYTVTLPDGFDANQIAAQGMSFAIAANPSSPSVGEFVQVGVICTLTGSTSHTIPDFSVAIVQGTGTYALPAPTLAIATFDLTGTDIVFVDGIDFHGVSFVPALVPANPKSGDFFWRSPLLNCFLSIALLSSLKTKQTTSHYSAKNLSSVQYQGAV